MAFIRMSGGFGREEWIGGGLAWETEEHYIKKSFLTFVRIPRLLPCVLGGGAQENPQPRLWSDRLLPPVVLGPGFDTVEGTRASRSEPEAAMFCFLCLKSQPRHLGTSRRERLPD